MLKLMDRQALSIVAFKTPKDMQGLVDHGEALKVCWHCGTTNPARPICVASDVKHVWTYRATDLFFKRDSGRSSAALTAQDSRGVAGMGGRRAVMRARLRVGWWHLIVSDPLNPLPVALHVGAACPIPVTRQPLPRPL